MKSVRIFSIFRAFSLAVLFSLCLFPARAGALEFGETSLSAEQQQRLDAYISQLGNASYKVREQAVREIMRFGTRAVDTLEKVQDSQDFTASEMARYCLNLLNRNLQYADDSQNVQALLSKYENSEVFTRMQILNLLADFPSGTSVRPLLRVMLKEKNTVCSQSAALAVMWNLPYAQKPHQFPQLFPEEKIYPDPDWLAAQNRTVLQERGELLVKIRDYLQGVSQNSPGKRLLLTLIQLELSWKASAAEAENTASEAAPENTASAAEAETKTSAASVSEKEKLSDRILEVYTPFLNDVNAEHFSGAAILLQNLTYVLRDMLFQAGFEEEKIMPQLAYSGEMPYSVNLVKPQDAYNDNRLSYIIQRYNTIQFLFNRGHWDFGVQEITALTSEMQPMEKARLLPHFSIILTAAGHYSELIKEFKENRRFLFLSGNSMEEEQQKAAALTLLLQAQEACVKRDYDSAKKALTEHLMSKNELDIDVLILAFRVAKQMQDAQWLADIEKRIDRELNSNVKDIQEMTQGRSRNSMKNSLENTLNGFAWLAGNTDRRLEEAEQNALHALEILPEQAGITDTLAQVYFAQGRYEDAFRKQAEAVELQPLEKLHLTANLERFRIYLPKNDEKE